MLLRHGLALAVFASLSIRIASAAETTAPGPRPIDPRAAIEPAAPVLPADVVAAMQDGRFGPAQEALARLAAQAASPGERSYYTLIQGISQRLGGLSEEARKTFSAALLADPKGVWAAKLRIEL